jgi:hypothetical protein
MSVRLKVTRGHCDPSDIPAGTWKVEAFAEDTAGNVEKRPHSFVAP